MNIFTNIPTSFIYRQQLKVQFFSSVFCFFYFLFFQYVFTLLIKEYILMQCRKRQINQIVSTRMTKCDKQQKNHLLKTIFLELTPFDKLFFWNQTHHSSIYL